MAIAPLRIAPTPEAANAFDFAPLAKLAQQINQPAPQAPTSLADLGQAAAQPSVFDTGSGTSYSRKGGGDYAGAISNIESGGRYDLLGPVTKSGDRAYGKYQVMGANVPEWSRAALGPVDDAAGISSQTAIAGHHFPASLWPVRRQIRAGRGRSGVVCRARRHEQPERQGSTRDVGC